MSDSTSIQLPPPTKTICCIGAGYVGVPTSAVIAKYCPEHTVYVVDIDRRRIDAWNSDTLPLYEPGLKELVTSVRGVNLFFTTDADMAIKQSDLIFIAVNTPTKSFGHWQNNGYDLSACEAVTRTIAKCADTSKIVIEKSTVPVRTAAYIRKIFEANKVNPNVHIEIISNPEFMAEGTAVRDIEAPDRILIGGLDTPSGHEAVNRLAAVYKHWVDPKRIITTGLWSSELSKLACNAFLAQRISSINSLSALCETTGADVQEVAKVIGTDSRVGSEFLRASVGFGGSCFNKDLLGLIYLCEAHHLPETAEYWRQVIKINEYQKQRFAKNVVLEMFGNVRGKNICLFGFAFKKDTGDIRDSAAIDVTRFLLNEGARIFIYDPKAAAHEIRALFPDVVCEKSAYTAAHETHAIVVITEWDEFKTLDYERIFNHMEKPAFIFDGRNVLDHSRLRSIGFHVRGIGKPGPDAQ